MEEMIGKQGQVPAVLESYTQQGQMFLFHAAQNLIQFGRVLTEAKPLVPRGQFERWVQTSFRMSERTAQGYMAVWKRFGASEQFQNIQFSNLQKMLALPEGTEEDFAQAHDLDAMTAREVEKAVREVREALEKERTARTEAEEKICRLQATKEEIPDRVKADMLRQERQIAEYQREIMNLSNQASSARAEKKEADRLLRDARQELSDAEEALAESQRDYDRLQGELLNAQSAAARGDAERNLSDSFTLEDFSAAVRGFLGSTAQMPYMGAAFSDMETREYRQWDELLRAVEDWVKRARKTLMTGGDILG